MIFMLIGIFQRSYYFIKQKFLFKGCLSFLFNLIKVDYFIIYHIIWYIHTYNKHKQLNIAKIIHRH